MSADYSPIALAIQALAKTISPWGNAVYLSWNSTWVPDYRSIPFLVVSFGGATPMDETGQNSQTQTFWDLTQYHDVKNTELASVGMLVDGGQAGILTCMGLISAAFNRGTLGGLVDYSWVISHSPIQVAQIVGASSPSSTARATSRLKCDGFNEG